MLFLSEQQIDEFYEKGFLVLPNMAKPSERKKLIAQADHLVNSLQDEWFQSVFSTKKQTETTNAYFLESGDKVRVFMEEGEVRETKEHRVNKLGHALHELDPVFGPFSQKKIWLMMAKELGMQSPKVLQSMYIFKQPKIGGEVNVHQDATFLYTNPVSVIGFWFAVQDATKENGCLWALPGGHKLGLKSRFVRKGQQTRMEILDETPLPEEGYVPVEVKAGTMVLLHGLLPHYSEANRSSNPRQAYALHLIDQATEYPTDNWLQASRVSEREKA